MNHSLNFAPSLLYLFEETSRTHREQVDYSCNSNAEAGVSVSVSVSMSVSMGGRYCSRCKEGGAWEEAS